MANIYNNKTLHYCITVKVSIVRVYNSKSFATAYKLSLVYRLVTYTGQKTLTMLVGVVALRYQHHTTQSEKERILSVGLSSHIAI